MSKLIKFETECTYQHGWINDSTLFTRYIVTRRTEKSIWIKREGSDKPAERKVIKIYDGSEIVDLGNYSMAPTLRASKKVDIRHEENVKRFEKREEEREEKLISGYMAMLLEKRFTFIDANFKILSSGHNAEMKIKLMETVRDRLVVNVEGELTTREIRDSKQYYNNLKLVK